MTRWPGDLKKCDVTKIKLNFFLNFQKYFLDSVFQPENVGKINLDKKIVSKQFLAKALNFFFLEKKPFFL